ncbi:hypothetical protein [Streptomyces yangpuensis]|uniref:hypothetical protein n=1 Tax=Streptomyces yangpuensis TaxID=1648182 RepID=UPI0006291999|nr:hypothetical protein [Streptomyces yangpuensis]
MDSISYIHPAAQQPAAESRLFAIDRIGLSAVLGIDVDLVRGPAGAEDELEYTRLCALVDMTDAGLISVVTLDLIGGLIEDMEREDDDLGPEPEGRSGILPVSDADIYGEADDYFATGWAA